MKSELFICACQWQYLVLPGVSDTGWRVCDHNTAFCSCKFPREFWLAGCCLLVWTLRSTQQFLSLQMHFWAWTLALWQSVLRWDPEERLSLGNTSVLLCFWRIRVILSKDGLQTNETYLLFSAFIAGWKVILAWWGMEHVEGTALNITLKKPVYSDGHCGLCYYRGALQWSIQKCLELNKLILRSLETCLRVAGLTGGGTSPKPCKAPGACPSVVIEAPMRAQIAQLPHGVLVLVSGSYISLSRKLHST